MYFEEFHVFLQNSELGGVSMCLKKIPLLEKIVLLIQLGQKNSRI